MAETKKKSVHQRVEEIYALYPKKMGKSAGFRKAVVKCKTEVELARLEQAVANYIVHIIKNGTEPRFILYFSTFMNDWEDWLDPETGTVAKSDVDLSGIKFD